MILAGFHIFRDVAQPTDSMFAHQNWGPTYHAVAYINMVGMIYWCPTYHNQTPMLNLPHNMVFFFPSRSPFVGALAQVGSRSPTCRVAKRPWHRCPWFSPCTTTGELRWSCVRWLYGLVCMEVSWNRIALNHPFIDWFSTINLPPFMETPIWAEAKSEA
jgi:hypothetical protein